MIAKGCIYGLGYISRVKFLTDSQGIEYDAWQSMNCSFPIFSEVPRHNEKSINNKNNPWDEKLLKTLRGIRQAGSELNKETSTQMYLRKYCGYIVPEKKKKREKEIYFWKMGASYKIGRSVIDRVVNWGFIEGTFIPPLKHLSTRTDRIWGPLAMIVVCIPPDMSSRCGEAGPCTEWLVKARKKEEHSYPTDEQVKLPNSHTVHSTFFVDFKDQKIYSPTYTP